MKGHNLRRTLVAAGLVAAPTMLVPVLMMAGSPTFIVTPAGAGGSWNASMDELSAVLMQTEGGYAFIGGEYLAEKELWAMLVDEGGTVVWQQGKPTDIPDRYSLTDVATFTRWYLSDYPVQTRVREDGLLAADDPRGSAWKHPFVLDMDILKTIPFWSTGLFLLALLRMLGLTTLALGRQFRREQRERNFARSDWINGISHDIHTPLSMVMGHAGQLEADPILPPRRRTQAAIIRRQSQTIRGLINDLNLAMRLDYAMQPLQRGSLHPAAPVRQVVADVLNGGLEERYALAVGMPPEAETLTLEEDVSLLRRALLNLMNNCVHHNPEGCSITLTAAAEGEVYTLRVEGGGDDSLPDTPAGGRLAPDSGATHSTGLRPVEQIARAHDDALELHRTAWGVLAVLRLPL